MMRMMTEAVAVIGNSFPLSLAVKVTAILGMAVIATRIARRSRASVRHLILSAAFIALPALPLGARFVPSIRFEIPLKRDAPSTIVGLAADADAGNIAGRITPVHNTGAEGVSISGSTVLGVLWALGTLLFLMPAAAGLWGLHRLRRSAMPWPGRAALLEALAVAAGVERRIDLLLSGAIAGPMTYGLLRPAIIFPAAAQSWSDEDQRRALIHELEHVRRRDCVTHGAARMVCAVYWFHPLVWIAWRRLGLEAERACDDAVLGGDEATDYADQLVMLARQMTAKTAMPLLAMANRSDLKARVEAVLDARQPRGRAGTRCAIAVLAATVLLVAVISPLRAVSAVRERETVQAATGAPPEFEVASVKPNKQAKGPYMIGVLFQPGGRVSLANAPLSELIRSAYGLKFKQLDDNGFALLSETFDVDARPNPNSLPQDAPADVRNVQIRLMMQKLLAERFKLVLHKETQEMALYALVVAKNGPRLKPTPDSECLLDTKCGFGGGPAGGLHGRGVQISTLVDVLSVFADRPVVDRTGIQGRFDIALPSWSRSPGQIPGAGELNGAEPAPNPLDPSLFVVLQENLGLRLEAIRGPFDIYVVDHVEQPSPN